MTWEPWMRAVVVSDDIHETVGKSGGEESCRLDMTTSSMVDSDLPQVDTSVSSVHANLPLIFVPSED